MKDWIKEKLVMTPKRRLDASYFLGTFQAILVMTFMQKLNEGDLTVTYWILMITSWIIIGLLYLKNNISFQKETLWMTIKNPAKVTREEGELKSSLHWPPPPGMAGMKQSSSNYNAPPPQGSRPPPPPKPPAGRGVRGPT